MDEYFFRAINQFAGQSNLLDDTLRWTQTDYFKTIPVMMLLWGLWFRYPEREQEVRERIVAILLLCLPIMLAARVAASFLPFSYRPLHLPGFEINLAYDQNVLLLDGWSSMPSDHAALFFALAAGFLTISRVAGLLAGALALFFICLPRIYFGWHWPSDILAGALMGGFVMLLFVSQFDRFVRWTGIVPFFTERAWLGYPLLFLVTFEVSQMFFLSRSILKNVVDL